MDDIRKGKLKKYYFLIEARVAQQFATEDLASFLRLLAYLGEPSEETMKDAVAKEAGYTDFLHVTYYHNNEEEALDALFHILEE